MSTAIAFALVAMVAWSLWAVFATLATRGLRPGVATTISLLAAVVVTGTYALVWRPPEGTVPTSGVGFSVLSGVALAVGSIAFYVGLSTGRTSVVTAISAMYFVLAAILGVVFLGDSLSWLNQVGIVVAAIGIGLLIQ